MNCFYIQNWLVGVTVKNFKIKKIRIFIYDKFRINKLHNSWLTVKISYIYLI